MCNGAILLAAAGLLAGKRVTTHWSFADLMRARYPDVRVDPDPIYIIRPPVVADAGVVTVPTGAGLGHDVDVEYLASATINRVTVGSQ